MGEIPRQRGVIPQPKLPRVLAVLHGWWRTHAADLHDLDASVTREALVRSGCGDGRGRRSLARLRLEQRLVIDVDATLHVKGPFRNAV